MYCGPQNSVPLHWCTSSPTLGAMLVPGSSWKHGKGGIKSRALLLGLSAYEAGVPKVLLSLCFHPGPTQPLKVGLEERHLVPPKS